MIKPSQKPKQRKLDKSYGARTFLTIGALTGTLLGWSGFAQSALQDDSQTPDIASDTSSVVAEPTAAFTFAALPTVIPLVQLKVSSTSGATFPTNEPAGLEKQASSTNVPNVGPLSTPRKTSNQTGATGAQTSVGTVSQGVTVAQSPATNLAPASSQNAGTAANAPQTTAAQSTGQAAQQSQPAQQQAQPAQQSAPAPKSNAPAAPAPAQQPAAQAAAQQPAAPAPAPAAAPAAAPAPAPAPAPVVKPAPAPAPAPVPAPVTKTKSSKK